MKIVLKVIGSFLYYLSYLFPRSNKIWVFGAWNGDNYSDNSKYFFEYINRNKPNIKARWITKNPSVVQIVRNRGYSAYHVNSVRGVYYSLRAKVGIVSSGNMDINQYLIGNMSIIQLWHGIPLKKIMFDDSLHKPDTKYSKLLNFIFPYRMGKYSILIATSTEVQDKIASAFRISKDKVKITGFPRNEAFIRNNEYNLMLEEIDKHKSSGKKVGLYLPTFRDNNPKEFIDEIVTGFLEMDKKLESINCFIYVKMHYMHLSMLNETKVTFNNVRIIHDSEILSDIYPVLPRADFLITDYSSIYFDYLLLKKPIIFYPFDIETYVSASRNLYYDYNEVTPGIKAYDENQLYNAIKKVINNEDEHADMRNSILNIFHSETKGNYSENLFHEILEIIG